MFNFNDIAWMMFFQNQKCLEAMLAWSLFEWFILNGSFSAKMHNFEIVSFWNNKFILNLKLLKKELYWSNKILNVNIWHLNNVNLGSFISNPTLVTFDLVTKQHEISMKSHKLISICIKLHLMGSKKVLKYMLNTVSFKFV